MFGKFFCSIDLCVGAGARECVWGKSKRYKEINAITVHKSWLIKIFFNIIITIDEFHFNIKL